MLSRTSVRAALQPAVARQLTKRICRQVTSEYVAAHQMKSWLWLWENTVSTFCGALAALARTHRHFSTRFVSETDREGRGARLHWLLTNRIRCGFEQGLWVGIATLVMTVRLMCKCMFLSWLACCLSSSASPLTVAHIPHVAFDSHCSSSCDPRCCSSSRRCPLSGPSPRAQVLLRACLCACTSAHRHSLATCVPLSCRDVFDAGHLKSPTPPPSITCALAHAATGGTSLYAQAWACTITNSVLFGPPIYGLVSHLLVLDRPCPGLLSEMASEPASESARDARSRERASESESRRERE